MKHFNFQFSVLKSVGYSNDNQVLEVYFTDGTRHRYKSVPSTIYFSLVNAYSPDTYYEKYIKPFFKYVATR